MNTYELETSFATLSAMFENGEIEEDIYNDTLESLPVEEAAEQIAKMRRNFEGDIESVDEEMKRLRNRKESLAKAKDRANETLLRLLHMRGGKIKTPLFGIHMRRTVAVDITDPDAVDAAYKTTVETVTINKTAVRDALKSGLSVTGAQLKENESVILK